MNLSQPMRTALYRASLPQFGGVMTMAENTGEALYRRGLVRWVWGYQYELTEAGWEEARREAERGRSVSGL